MIDKIFNIKPEKIFLIFAILFGTAFLVVTPPYQVPDENYHFFQAFTISEFYSNSNDGVQYIPEFYIKLDSAFKSIPFTLENKVYLKEIIELFKKGQDSNDLRVPFICPASHYSFMLYAPQVVGIWIGRLFSAPPIVVFYLGRIFAMIFWITVVYYSIKITPLPKWMFFLIVITPISLFQGVSMSADSVLNSISFILLAIILKYAFDENSKKLDFKALSIMIFLSLVITMSKPPYIILLLTYFFIPFNKFKTKSKYFLFFFVILFVNLLLIIVWNTFIKTPINSDLAPKNEQFSFILNNPFGYLKIFLNTIIIKSPALIQQVVGKLGWLDVRIPDAIVMFYLIVMLYTGLYDKSEFIINIKKSQRYLIIIIFISIVSLIFTLFFLITSKDSNIIEGLQGRYFIPFFPVFFLILYNRKFNCKENRIRLIVIFTSFITLISSVFSLIFRYYYL